MTWVASTELNLPLNTDSRTGPLREYQSAVCVLYMTNTQIKQNAFIQDTFLYIFSNPRIKSFITKIIENNIFVGMIY